MENIEIKSFDTYIKVEDIMLKELKEIREIIQRNMSEEEHEPCKLPLTNSCTTNTALFWEYARKTNDIYSKAYFMQNVVDNVLDTYFNTLVQIEKELIKENKL